MLAWLLELSGCFLRDFMQIMPQVDKQSDRDAHYDQRTDAKNQEPPDHPHSAIRITDARCALLQRRQEAALRSATRWRMVSTRLVMNSRRFLPHLVRVTTCSMVRKNSGSSSFLRSSLT